MRQKRAAIERALASEKVLCNIDTTASVTRSSWAAGAATDGGDGGDGDEAGGGGEGTLESAGISAKEIKNIYTELRKGANHPLMLLNYFKGEGKTMQVVDVLHRTGYFGSQATRDMVGVLLFFLRFYCFVF